jgi:thiosulfate/3-mercaptopyruvate sulfurtransferase
VSDLVSTAWLAEHLRDVRAADASWHMPGEKRDARAEFEAGHIPGAVFFDIDAISHKSTDLPHMLPPAAQFKAAMESLDIGNDDRIVVYDKAGMFSAARAWWMLKAMGHDKVSILDGGFPKWEKEGRPAASGRAESGRKGQIFTPRPNPALIRDFDAVMDVVKDRSAQMVDARSPGRFTAAEPEPRAGVRGGHMPGARNVHYRALLNPDGTFKSLAELRAIFGQAGVDLARPIVTTCGTGVTAAILMLALGEIGAREVALYDGSWTEWGSRPEAPVVTG